MMDSKSDFHKTIDISFIVPVYNTDICLLSSCIKCITSIKSKKCECVIVDDGSDSNKSNEYENLCKKIENVRYYKQVNTGVSGARNAGIEIASGKYIYFCDSDDQILPDFFEEVIMSEKYDIYFTKMIVSMSKRKIETCIIDTKNCEITSKKVFDSLLSCGFLNGPYCKLIKRSFILNNNVRFDIMMKNGEDLVFLLDMIKSNPSMYYVNANSYIYHYDLNTRKNRVINEPQRCIEDDKIFSYKMIRTAEEINKSAFELHELESVLTRIRINSIFLDASNIAAYAQNKLNAKVKDMYQQEMRELEISKIVRPSLFTKVEYDIICSGSWKTLFLISKCRSLYLSIKVKISEYR